MLPNMRLKLSARGGRAIREWSFLSAAAAGRSLSAFRYAAPDLKTRLLYSICARVEQRCHPMGQAQARRDHPSSGRGGAPAGIPMVDRAAPPTSS